MVFPTPVGVFPPEEAFAQAVEGLPHARGGVSLATGSRMRFEGSSPRPWGCFWYWETWEGVLNVFPTPVGVFLKTELTLSTATGLPHARGGVSTQFWMKLGIGRSSPRPWGCFQPAMPVSVRSAVFPTPVGVFPKAHTRWAVLFGLPHARGGVSMPAVGSTIHTMSSPRPWGCF